MRLAISFAGKQKTHYLDLRIKSYGCLKFEGEVWAGRACAAANEEELTACAKFCGQGGWARGAGGGQSGASALGRSLTAGRGSRLRSAQRSATAGRQGRMTAGRAAIARQATANRPSTRRPAVAGLPTAALGGRRPPVSRRPRVATCLYIFFHLFFEKKDDIFL
jgi:hypothetical protein